MTNSWKSQCECEKKLPEAGILARYFFVIQLFSVNLRHGIIQDSRWLENIQKIALSP